jgi:hypothetical protein
MHDILSPIAEPRIDRWRESREGVDDRQHADFTTCCELVVNEIHRPGLVDLSRFGSAFAQLGLDPTLRRFVA